MYAMTLDEGEGRRGGIRARNQNVTPKFITRVESKV